MTVEAITKQSGQYVKALDWLDGELVGWLMVVMRRNSVCFHLFTIVLFAGHE